MSASQPSRSPSPSPGFHLATIAYEGTLWDTYLEFDDDAHHPLSFRGRLRFEQAGGEGDPISAETTVIIIEESYEEAVMKARAFDERQLNNLLRSALPDEG